MTETHIQIAMLGCGIWFGCQLGTIFVMMFQESAKERRWKRFAKQENDQIRWRQVWQS